MKITTWNVNGVRAREAQVLEWIEREHPDVLCLQEIKASREQVPASLIELPGYWCYWHGGSTKGYSGVALHLSKTRFPEAPSFSHPEYDHENRIVVAQVGEQHFASVYVPNGGKDFVAKVRFLDALEVYVRGLHAEGKRLILCGDLNVAREPRDVHPKLRDPAQIGQTPDEQKQLERILSQGLTDTHRAFESGNDELFTWWAPWRNQRQRNIGWRLDYVLSSMPFAERAKGCRVDREFGTSDHAPVTAEFADF